MIRDFRKVVDAAGHVGAGVGAARDPAQLRLTAVRQRMSIEQHSRLVGHSSTAVTELVYRKQIRPVIEDGAITMDRLFPDECPADARQPPGDSGIT